LARLGRALAVGKGRMQAARAVMQVAPERYAGFQQALVEGLAAAQSRVRFECAHALDTFGDATTRAPLAVLMDDPVPRVRWIAMHALSCHACGEKPDALEAAIRERIIDAAAHDPSPQVRRHAAVSLGLAHEASAAPVLDAMLADEADAKTRRMAGWARAELARR
jgi:HEAT repeat protein